MDRKTTLSICVLVLYCTLAASAAQAQSSRKKPAPSDYQRPYVHVCAPGTEQFGEAPPKGHRVWCRMPIARNQFILQGAYTQYYEGGHRKVEGEYDRNLKTGKWVSYYPNGRKRSEAEYVDGKEVKRTIYDGNGRPIDRTKQRERQERIQKNREKTKEQTDWLSKTRKIKFNPNKRSR